MDKFLLAFELTPDHDQIEIHADEAGLRRFIKNLEQLLSSGEPHAHLKTPAWGGAELTDEPQANGHNVVNHVKVFCWRSLTSA